MLQAGVRRQAACGAAAAAPRQPQQRRRRQPQQRRAVAARAAGGADAPAPPPPRSPAPTKQVLERLNALKRRLDDAVAQEDYGAAQQLKQQADELRGQLPPVQQYMLHQVETLSGGAPAERRAAVSALATVGDESCLPALAACLRDPELNRPACDAMWTVFNRHANPAVVALMEQGAAMLQPGSPLVKYRAALEVFEQACRLEPSFAEAHNKRATALYLMQRYAESIEVCRLVLQLNPHHFGAASGMGMCFLGLDDHRAALSAFETALEINPELDPIQTYPEEEPPQEPAGPSGSSSEVLNDPAAALGGFTPPGRLYDPYEQLGGAIAGRRAAFQLPEGPEFVFQEEAAAKRRSWSENLQFYTGLGYLGGGATGFAVGGYRYMHLPADPAFGSVKLKANRLINTSGSLGRRMACSSAILGLYFSVAESYLTAQVDGLLPDEACTVAAGFVAAGLFRSLTLALLALTWCCSCCRAELERELLGLRPHTQAPAAVIPRGAHGVARLPWPLQLHRRARRRRLASAAGAAGAAEAALGRPSPVMLPVPQAPAAVQRFLADGARDGPLRIPVWFVVVADPADAAATNVSEAQLAAQVGLLNRAYATGLPPPDGTVLEAGGRSGGGGRLWAFGLAGVRYATSAAPLCLGSSAEAAVKAAWRPRLAGRAAPDRALVVYVSAIAGAPSCKGGAAGYERMFAYSNTPTDLVFWKQHGLEYRDGVVIDPSYLLDPRAPPGGGAGALRGAASGAQLVHEIGHWMGLGHTWDGGCAAGAGGAGGDQVSDTPAEDHPTHWRGVDMGDASGACGEARDSCPGEPGADLVDNYMNYNNLACADSFTPGQQARALYLFRAVRADYEHLVRVCPEHDAYKLHCAHAQHKAGMFAEAARTAVRVTDPELARHVNTLLAVNAYQQDDLAGCSRQLERCGAGCEVEAAINAGCVLYKQGDFAGAAAKFREAEAVEGSQPELQYNLALCCYKLKQHSQALRHLAEIVERGVREHPELGLDGVGARSVGNSTVLKETALVEAFNLKAAIELAMNNAAAAAEALADMPPRAECELDPVTLHNLALSGMGRDPGGGFKKLNFLLSSGAFPPEAFANLLLLYVSPAHAFYDLAADVMAESPGHCAELLSKARRARGRTGACGGDLQELLHCLVSGRAAPEAALAQLDELSGRHVSGLRGLTKAINDARLSRDADAIRASIAAYDEALERYIPVLMAMGSIYWERGAYASLEALLRQSAEFCSEHDAWKLNVAHTAFMQARRQRGPGCAGQLGRGPAGRRAWAERAAAARARAGGRSRGKGSEKHRDAIRHYQPLVARQRCGLLRVTAIVLANLCVSYIMTSQARRAQNASAARRGEGRGAARRGGAFSRGCRGPGGGGRRCFTHAAVRGARRRFVVRRRAQNEEAEELMRQVEREEEAAAAAAPGALQLHLCIINLVIGTLYCSKGNYEFGVSRIIKSLEPHAAKLSTDTWFYAKRCFLSLAEGLAKHMTSLGEAAWDEVLAFLEGAERAGRGIPAAFWGAGAGAGGGRGAEGATVASEARALRALFLRLRTMASAPRAASRAAGPAEPVTVVLHAGADFTKLVRLRLRLPGAAAGRAAPANDDDDDDDEEAAAEAAAAAAGALHEALCRVEAAARAAGVGGAFVAQAAAADALQLLCPKDAAASVYKALMPHQEALGFSLGSVKACISLAPLGAWELHEVLHAAAVKALTGSSCGVPAGRGGSGSGDAPAGPQWMGLSRGRLVSADLLAAPPGQLAAATLVEFEAQGVPPSKLLLCVRSAGTVKFRPFSPMQALAAEPKALRAPLALGDGDAALLADAAKLAAAARQLEGRAVKLLPDERTAFIKGLRAAPTDPDALARLARFWLGHHGLALPPRFPFLVGLAGHADAEEAALEAPSCCVLAALGLQPQPGAAPGGAAFAGALRELLDGLRGRGLQLFGPGGLRVEADAGGGAGGVAAPGISAELVQVSQDGASAGAAAAGPRLFSMSAGWSTASALLAASKAAAATAPGGPGGAQAPAGVPAPGLSGPAAQMLGLQELQDLGAPAGADSQAGSQAARPADRQRRAGGGGSDFSGLQQFLAAKAAERAAEAKASVVSVALPRSSGGLLSGAGRGGGGAAGRRPAQGRKPATPGGGAAKPRPALGAGLAAALAQQAQAGGAPAAGGGGSAPALKRPAAAGGSAAKPPPAAKRAKPAAARKPAAATTAGAAPPASEGGAPAPAAAPPKPRKPKAELDLAAVTAKVHAAHAAGCGVALKGVSVPEMQAFLRAHGQRGGPTKKAEVEARLLALLAAQRAGAGGGGGGGASPNADMAAMLRSARAGAVARPGAKAAVAPRLAGLPARRPSVAVRASYKAPDVDAEELNKKLQETASNTGAWIQTKWEETEDKPAAIAVTGGALLLLVAASSVVDAVDKIPVISDLIELVGVVVTGWFSYRYLVFGPDREELVSNIKARHARGVGMGSAGGGAANGAPGAAAAAVSSAAGPPPARRDDDWDALLDILSGLIKHKTRADGKNWRDAHENMPVYLERLGIQDAVQRLSVVHVAGTKGKGSTCAMVESVLRASGYSTGMFTSPHLCDVRERVRLNGRMVSKSAFGAAFWRCYNALAAAATPEVGMPGYFRFLTLLALQVFVEAAPDVVILEVGIGGRIDATNVLRAPAVTGIASLGFDHMELLGHTLGLIAAEKAGIMRPRVPCFTVPQPPEAMASLEACAAAVGTEVQLAPPLAGFAAAAAAPGGGIAVGLAGEHQRLNASLAVALARAWEAHRAAAQPAGGADAAAAPRLAPPPPPPLPGGAAPPGAAGAAQRLQELAAGQLPAAYGEGLRTAAWPGRSQVVPHPGFALPGGGGGSRLTLYLDGAHTPESMVTCGVWFAQAAGAGQPQPAGEQAQQQQAQQQQQQQQQQQLGQHGAQPEGGVLRVLLFNCMRERDPEVLLPHLFGALRDAGAAPAVALFVPPDSQYAFLPTSSKAALVAEAHADLSWQAALAGVWQRCQHGGGGGGGGGEGAAERARLPPLPDVPGVGPQDAASGAAVLGSVGQALGWLEAAAHARPGVRLQVLVTGSLYLVGDTLVALHAQPE
ncbi:ttc30a [Scenedesmus sp. PABB004]|nr:ttc30a [Scenedesmus sp. PABB004]